MSLSQLQELISPRFDEQVISNIVFKKHELFDIKINNVIIDNKSGNKGDSYLSIVYRFTVDAVGRDINGQEKAVNVHVIVKVMPTNIARRKTFRSNDFFENEIIFYEKVWPAFDAFQKSKNPLEVFDKIPLLLAAFHDGEKDYVALEDLSYLNYDGIHRSNGLNYEHTIAILKLFAEFHGLGLAFKDQHPTEFDRIASSLKETYFAEKYRTWYINFQKKLYAIVKDAVDKELPPVYSEKYEALFEGDFYGKLCKMCEERGQFSVVTHGDSWIPNFLVNYEGDELKDVIFIDFQLTRYTSLSTDLNFFFYTCIEPTLLENHWDEFIEIYFKNLQATLQKLGSNSNLISFAALKEDIEKHAVFGIGMSIEAVTFSLLDDEDVSDLDNIQGEESLPLECVWMVHPYKEQEKRKRLAFFIKFAVDKGFI